MYLCDCENGTGYAGFEKTSIFSMNQKKDSDSRLYCKMEPNRGGRFFHTPGSVGGKAVAFVGVKGDNCFNKPDGSDGDQIFGIFFQILIFFNNMRDKTQIVFDQDMFCLEVSFCIFLNIIFFFRGR